MNFSFHPDARVEFHNSIDYYKNIQIELGVQFTKEVFASIERILEYPYSSFKLSENSRRCLINRFPFAIMYQIKESEIVIIAVTHLNRKPNYWKNREE